MERTYIADTPKKVGKKVRINGFVSSIRDHGKITFLDIRDMTGTVQCVGQNLPKTTPESTVEISGEISNRPEKLVNKDLETGKIELQIEDLKVLNLSKELPFPVDDDGYSIGEEHRLKYRYLDLRRPRLQKNLKLRSDYVKAAREYLFSKNFTEIETPLLSQTTPEGSRDFVVPSRVYPGKFFALPQSPQQYKQLLMAAGFEKYFQIAKCLRDEDPRADRAYEHTQIDLELSFVERKDVMQLVEELVVHASEETGFKIAKKPFPVISYDEAIEKYGADKFDLRTDEEKKKGILSFAWVVDFPSFEKTEEGNWTFSHNPFSAPLDERNEKLLLEKKNIGKIISAQYDLVMNGFEVGGGSIRTHKPEVLKTVFEIMGYDEKKITKDFGHMLEAFEYGTPPHGGCAIGFERILMAALNEEFLREIQAFPQSGKGRTAVMNAPSEISKEQLKELGLKVVK